LIENVSRKFNVQIQLNRETLPEIDFRTDQVRDKSSVVNNEKSVAMNTMDKPTIEVNTPSIVFPEKEKIPEEVIVETSSIRVQVGLLDKLMNLIGEMVLTRNQVLQYAKQSEDNDFLKLTQRLDLITSELQDNVMKTRMQPIGNIFSKFQRVVRDLARDLDKKIDLNIVGAETELDKSLIEAIKDPLTHIVRNSCDHGIETPHERKTKGKNELGHIGLKAFHEGGQIIIEIDDDGKGLDPERLKSKAIEKGIITKDRASLMNEKEAQELIFHPGFSTAAQVTSVSGRGVGMDVVKTNIEKVGGSIELNSKNGLGTQIKLRIPLTLAIVPAMIIKSQNHNFAIPQLRLQELLRVDLEEDKNKIENLQGKNFFRLRNVLLPLVSCTELMGIKSLDQRTIINIVVLQGEGHLFGLVVDEILDTADIVVKPLPSFLKKVDLFSGATIMGDGSVALIIDTEGIAANAHFSQKSSDQQNHKFSSENDKKIMNRSVFSEYLTFYLFDRAIYAIPLVLVNRLEEFKRNQIEYSAGEVFVKYRDGLLPLIFMDNVVLGNSVNIKDLDTVNVVVISKNNRVYGLVVESIVDILLTDKEIISLIKEKQGLMGTIVVNDKDVLTVVDSYKIIDKVLGIETTKPIKTKKKARILLAEDTAFFIKQITKVLVEAGHEVEHAENGQEAIKILENYSNKHFDLVISDIEMPVLNGFELAQNIRKKTDFKQIPLVALTTRFKDSDQEMGRSVGFDYYLEKLKSDELLNTVNEIMGVRQ
jgi:two-component system, chemotaxis family, sensor kinase CheA